LQDAGKVCLAWVMFATRLKLQSFRPAPPWGFYLALNGWPLSQHPRIT
jgi:hypothetical protein